MLQNTARLEICQYIVVVCVNLRRLVCFQEHAFESSQKYKEGKYIIELVHMIKDNGWDEDHVNYSRYLRK